MFCNPVKAFARRLTLDGDDRLSKDAPRTLQKHGGRRRCHMDWLESSAGGCTAFDCLSCCYSAELLSALAGRNVRGMMFSARIAPVSL
jgi:hypothetical protein